MIQKRNLPFVGSHQQLSKVQLESVTDGDSEIKPISSVRNLGVWLTRINRDDDELSCEQSLQ